MILTIFGISFILAIIFSLSKDDNDIFGTLALLSVCIAGLTLLCSCEMISTSLSSYERVIDEKIALYEEENAQIEANINAMVYEYMQHEATVIDTFAPSEDAITMVMFYPELKADTLVQKQIEILNKNNKQIKALKEEKINIQMNRWIVYFGN